jgi:protease IV
MKCKRCDYEYPAASRFCLNCGNEVIPKGPFWKRHKILTSFLLLSAIFVFLLGIGIVTLIREIGREMSRENQPSSISGKGDQKIALVNIDGIIVEKAPGGGLGSLSDEYASARRIKQALQEIEKDKDVRAVLLRINSPGGSAAASEEIVNEIRRFKSRTNLPVVSYFSDVAASGGYYIAMASDRIVANPNTITGSIGVIISYLDLSTLAERYGVNQVVYKSGELKDLGNPLERPTSEERNVMQALVDDAYRNFVDVIVKGRNLDEATVQRLGDGRIYSAKQALDNKLIDREGLFEDAVGEARNLAGMTEASVIEYGTLGFWDSILGVTTKRLNLGTYGLDQLLGGQKVQLLYLFSGH